MGKLYGTLTRTLHSELAPLLCPCRAVRFSSDKTLSSPPEHLGEGATTVEHEGAVLTVQRLRGDQGRMPAHSITSAILMMLKMHGRQPGHRPPELAEVHSVLKKSTARKPNMLNSDTLTSLPALRSFADSTGRIRGASIFGCLGMMLGLTCVACSGIQRPAITKRLRLKIQKFVDSHGRTDPLMRALVNRIEQAPRRWLPLLTKHDLRAPGLIAEEFLRLLSDDVGAAQFKAFLKPFVAGLFHNPGDQWRADIIAAKKISSDDDLPAIEEIFDPEIDGSWCVRMPSPPELLRTFAREYHERSTDPYYPFVGQAFDPKKIESILKYHGFCPPPSFALSERLIATWKRERLEAVDPHPSQGQGSKLCTNWDNIRKAFQERLAEFVR